MPGAVAIQAMGDVKILLEVIAEREIDEGGAGRRQLHAGGQTALNQREVACGEMTVEIGHEGCDLDADLRVQRPWINARTGDHDHAQSRDFCLRRRPSLQDAIDQVSADAGAADSYDADLLVCRISQRLPQLGSTAE